MTEHNARDYTFEAWSEKFERSRLGITAIAALKTIYGNSPSSLQERFKEEVLRVCYYAFEFRGIGDVNSEKRDILRDLSNIRDELHDKVAGVIHEIDFLRGVYDTIIAEGMREMMRDDFDELPADPELWKELREKAWLRVDDLLFNLELYRLGLDRLQEGFETLPLRDECWLHGNMRHPERIDGMNQHQGRKGATCLMFQLAIFFRLWTHPKGQKLFDKKMNLNIPKEGIAMPKEGKRHDKIIAAFVNATFSIESIPYQRLKKPMSEASIRARLEKIDPRMRLVPWTDESFDLPLKIPAQAADAVIAMITQKAARKFA